MGGIAAAHPLREPPVRPAGAEDPPARGGHHRLGPDPCPLRHGVAQDPARPHRTGGGARPADHALGAVITIVPDPAGRSRGAPPACPYGMTTTLTGSPSRSLTTRKASAMSSSGNRCVTISAPRSLPCAARATARFTLLPPSPREVNSEMSFRTMAPRSNVTGPG